MKIINDSKRMQAILEKKRQKCRSIGLVPTMGALHKGHLSLVHASKRENDLTVVSIFVNPTQFGPAEDFKKYPRCFKRDTRLLTKIKADYLFYPSVQQMYPEGFSKPVKIRGAKWPQLAKGLCGKFRPRHFQGVATIVQKLLDIVEPDRLYLGAKDYQQSVVLSQLVKDLGLKTRVRVMPTVREKDGLAMSSRNRYLSKTERNRARMISKVLFRLRADLRKQRTTVKDARSEALKTLQQRVDKVQYLEVVDAETLAPLNEYRKRMVAVTACFVGKTRLIDNVIIQFLQRQ